MKIMVIKRKYLLLSVLAFTFDNNFSGIISASILEEELFSFEIIGYMGYEGMVGVPYPPNFNFNASEIPEADTYAYYTLTKSCN
jgi:ABC-type microcin C transport system permease subunit YejB